MVQTFNSVDIQFINDLDCCLKKVNLYIIMTKIINPLYHFLISSNDNIYSYLDSKKI